MTDTTEPKPAKDKAMSEHIKPKPVAWIDDRGAIIVQGLAEYKKISWVSEHHSIPSHWTPIGAETAQQLQQRNERLVEALHQIANDPVITAATMRYLAQQAIIAEAEQQP